MFPFDGWQGNTPDQSRGAAGRHALEPDSAECIGSSGVPPSRRPKDVLRPTQNHRLGRQCLVLPASLSHGGAGMIPHSNPSRVGGCVATLTCLRRPGASPPRHIPFSQVSVWEGTLLPGSGAAVLRIFHDRASTLCQEDFAVWPPQGGKDRDAAPVPDQLLARCPEETGTRRITCCWCAGRDCPRAGSLSAHSPTQSPADWGRF
jgi:hypothetical protein